MAASTALEGAATGAAFNRAQMFEPLARSPSPLGRGRATPPLPTWPGAPAICSPGPLPRWPLSPSVPERQGHPGSASPITSRFARSSSPAPRNEVRAAGFVFPTQLARSSSPVKYAPPMVTVKPAAGESATIIMPSLLGQVRQLAMEPVKKEEAILPSAAALWQYQEPRRLQPTPSRTPDILAASLPASPWMAPRRSVSPQRSNFSVPSPCAPCGATPRWMDSCLQEKLLLEPGTWPQRPEQKKSPSPEAVCDPLRSLACAQLRCPSEPPMPCLVVPPDAKQQKPQQECSHRTDAAFNFAQEPSALPRRQPVSHPASISDEAASAPGVHEVISECQKTKDKVGNLTAVLKLLEGDMNSIRRENLELRLAMQQRLSGRSHASPGMGSRPDEADGIGQKRTLTQDSSLPERLDREESQGTGLQQPSWSLAVHPGASRHRGSLAEHMKVATTKSGRDARSARQSLQGDHAGDQEEAQHEQLDRLLAAQKAAEAAAIARQGEQQLRDLIASQEALKRMSEEKEAALQHELDAARANAKRLESKAAQEAAEAKDLESQLADMCRRNQQQQWRRWRL
eukprot:TRINITY_DN3321_c0_g2_i2.p2 TRINITY_DN3321_c0_g2~~TRINITY_DN3321_c0_g2_i2.p2  ORF type:complete len:571 (-),score=127.35 TRINITY_DN3321_c0_g2_i2:2513-4225(-)